MAAAPGVLVDKQKISPLAVAGVLLGFAQRNKAAKAQLAKDQWEKTNEVLDYADKFGLDISKFDELNRGLADETNIKLRQGTRDYLHNNPNDFRGAKMYAAKAADELKIKVAEYNSWKNEIDNATKRAQDGFSKGIYNKGAIESVRALYLNPDGSLKATRNPDGTLNDWAIRSSMNDTDKIWDNPAIYDEIGTIRDWVSNLKDNKNEFISKYSNAPGRTPDLVKQTIEGGLQYQMDPSDPNKLLLDDNMNPVPLINETYLKMARTNPEMRVILDNYGGKTTADQIKYLQERVTSKMDQPKFEQQKIAGANLDNQDKFYYAYGSGFRTPIADLESRDERLEKIVTKNRPDLLSGLSDPSSDLAAFYGDEKGNPVAPGQKPSTIVMVHVGRQEGADGNLAEQIAATDDVFAKMALMQKAGMAVKKEIYHIGDEEKNRKAKIALSLRLDKIDSKRSIGEEYSNFVEAKRKHKTGSIAEQMKAAKQQKK